MYYDYFKVSFFFFKESLFWGCHSFEISYCLHYCAGVGRGRGCRKNVNTLVQFYKQKINK